MAKIDLEKYKLSSEVTYWKAYMVSNNDYLGKLVIAGPTIAKIFGEKSSKYENDDIVNFAHDIMNNMSNGKISCTTDIALNKLWYDITEGKLMMDSTEIGTIYFWRILYLNTQSKFTADTDVPTIRLGFTRAQFITDKWVIYLEDTDAVFSIIWDDEADDIDILLDRMLAEMIKVMT